MSLVSKFNSFGINTKSDRISQEDKDWLERGDKLYRGTIETYKKMYHVYADQYRTYTVDDVQFDNMYHSLLITDLSIPNKLIELNKTYVDNIFSHFAGKYDVTLLNNFNHDEEFSRKVRIHNFNIGDDFKSIDYNDVVELIFSQLGGFNFDEKRDNEIKERLKNKSYNQYRSEWYIKIKGDRFTYTNGYMENWYGYGFKSVEWLKDVLDSISIIKTGSIKKIDSLDRLYRAYKIDMSEDDLKNGFSAPEYGIEKIKFFKNGRVDITFDSSATCMEFAKNWCGYTTLV